MIFGLDIGYYAVKCVHSGGRFSFPSVTGTLSTGGFSLSRNSDIAMLRPYPALVGESAVLQSRYTVRNEGRDWINSDEWLTLFLAAITQATQERLVTLDVALGLPPEFYSDRATLTKRLQGETFIAQREGRDPQRITVRNVGVAPQEMAAFADSVMDDKGRTVGGDSAYQHVGIIGIGSKTTNIVGTQKLTMKDHEVRSLEVGAWSLVRAVRQWLNDEHPGLEMLRDHELADAIQRRHITCHGREVKDFTAAIDFYASGLAGEIISAASQLWNGAGTLERILVTGGGALLLGGAITAQWTQASVVSDPIFANANGLYKLAVRMYEK